MPTDQSEPVAVLREHAEEIATACRHAPFDFRELLAELERRRDEEARLRLWQRQTGGTATRFPDGSWRLNQPHPTMGRAEHARTLTEALNKMGDP